MHTARALATWDAVHGWADYIAFLGKLAKALKKDGSDLATLSSADSLLLSHRLAQCLDPKLPSGVHQKTLEVYGELFGHIDLDSCANVYLPGLLPLLEHATMKTKPALLGLVRTHVVTLNRSLRALCRPFLIATLSSIDDEQSEYVDDILALVADLRHNLNDPSHFWQCFFLVVISCPAMRPGALVWARKHLPSFAAVSIANGGDHTEAQLATTPDPGLLLRAFSQGLRDPQMLVQRGFLDLLVTSIPLHSWVLDKAADTDKQLLIMAATSTVLRREVSFNRRLWLWLLGPEPDGDTSVDAVTTADTATKLSRQQYFDKFALEPLITGLLSLVGGPVESQTIACRICLSILDRWEIGSSIVPRMLLPVLRAVHEYPTPVPESLLAAAHSFFDGVEAISIWHDLLTLVLSSDPHDQQLFLFVLASFHVDDETMLVAHVPLVLLASLCTRDTDQSCIEALVQLTPSRALVPPADTTAMSDENIVQTIQAYYESSPSDDTPSPFKASVLSTHVLDRLCKRTAASLSGPLCTLLAGYIAKITDLPDSWTHADLVTALLSLKLSELPLDRLFGIASLFGCMHAGLDLSAQNHILSALAGRLWHLLADEAVNEDCRLQLVQALWILQDRIGHRRLESALATAMVGQVSQQARVSALASLWQHSCDRTNYDDLLTRLIYIALDDIPDIHTSLWLTSVAAHSTAPQLLHLLLDNIVSADFFRDGFFAPHHDIEVFAYNVRTLVTTLDHTPRLRQVYATLPAGLQAMVRFFALNPGLQELVAIEAAVQLVHLSLPSDNLDLVPTLTAYVQSQTDSTLLLHTLPLLNAAITQAGSKESIDLIMAGISRATTSTVIGAWVDLLKSVVRHTSSDLFFQSLIPIVEQLCQALKKFFADIKAAADGSRLDRFVQLANGLEWVVAHAEFRVVQEAADDTPESPNPAGSKTSPSSAVASSTALSPSPSFLGNVISGVLSVESPMARSTAANNKFTVLLCVQDTVRTTLDIWLWTSRRNSPSSYAHAKMSARMRKLLAHIYELEPLELVMCLVEVYFRLEAKHKSSVFRIMHSLDGSQPKMTVPHLFYAALHVSNSSVAAMATTAGDADSAPDSNHQLTESSITEFIVAYITSLQDDAIEDVWSECLAFVRECSSTLVYVHGEVIPALLLLIGAMATKVDRIKFGEQRKARRELSDLFIKIINFAFTKSTIAGTGPLAESLQQVISSGAVRAILQDNADRLQSCLSSVSGHMLAPAVKAKQFPASFTPELLSLWEAVLNFNERAPSKQLVAEAVLDPRFLTGLSSTDAVKWQPLVRRWAQTDHERVRDFVASLGVHSAVASPTLMFNWSDRDAENRANLKRLAFLFLSVQSPHHLCPDLTELMTRFEELGASAELFACVRALVLKTHATEPAPLAPVWTFIYTQLRQVFLQVLQDRSSVSVSVLDGACRLLDTCIVLGAEGFEIHQWLFVRDNMDSIMGHNLESLALVDRISALPIERTKSLPAPSYSPGDLRRPLLHGYKAQTMADLKWFFDNLAICAYEGHYSLAGPDLTMCLADVLADLFD